MTSITTPMTDLTEDFFSTRSQSDSEWLAGTADTI
jgi:hypothetical protein